MDNCVLHEKYVSNAVPSGPVYFTGSIYIFKARVSDQQLNIEPL